MCANLCKSPSVFLEKTLKGAVSSSSSDKVISTASRLSTLCREGCGLKVPQGPDQPCLIPKPEPFSEGTLSNGEKICPVLSSGRKNQTSTSPCEHWQVNLHIMTDEFINSLLSCLSNWFLLEFGLVTDYKATFFLVIECQPVKFNRTWTCSMTGGNYGPFPGKLDGLFLNLADYEPGRKSLVCVVVIYFVIR